MSNKYFLSFFLVIFIGACNSGHDDKRATNEAVAMPVDSTVSAEPTHVEDEASAADEAEETEDPTNVHSSGEGSSGSEAPKTSSEITVDKLPSSGTVKIKEKSTGKVSLMKVVKPGEVVLAAHPEEVLVSEPAAVVAKPTSTPSKKEPGYGNIAIYCSREMEEEREYDIAVVLSKILDEESLKDRTAEEMKNSTEGGTREEALAATDVYRVQTSRRMKVELKFQEGRFNIIYAPPNLEKIINEEDTTTEWHWTISPSSLGRQTLIVAVYRFDDEAGKWVNQGKPQRFEIIVKINKTTYFSKLWDFVKDKPEWPITTLIIPFVTYLAGLRRGRKKQKNLKIRKLRAL